MLHACCKNYIFSGFICVISRSKVPEYGIFAILFHFRYMKCVLFSRIALNRAILAIARGGFSSPAERKHPTVTARCNPLHSLDCSVLAMLAAAVWAV
jgi:hypothetical protein